MSAFTPNGCSVTYTRDCTSLSQRSIPSSRPQSRDRFVPWPSPTRLPQATRAVVATEVAYRGEFASPGFATRHGMPMFGAVALHIHGLPRNLVEAPDAHQARCLLARLDNIRGRLDPTVEGAKGNEALAAFSKDGQLPGDDLMLEAVLVHIELEELYAHTSGPTAA